MTVTKSQNGDRAVKLWTVVSSRGNDGVNLINRGNGGDKCGSRPRGGN